MSEKKKDPSFIDLYAQERNKPTPVLRPEDILDQRLPFQIRALRFREAVGKAEKALVDGISNNNLMWFARQGLQFSAERYRKMAETENERDATFHTPMAQDFERLMDQIDKALEARA